MHSKPVLKLDFKNFQSLLKQGIGYFIFIDSGEETKSSPKSKTVSYDDMVYIQIPEKYQHYIIQKKSFFFIIDEMLGISFSTDKKTSERKTLFANLGEAWLPFHYIEDLKQIEFSTWKFHSSDGSFSVEISCHKETTIPSKDPDLLIKTGLVQEPSVALEKNIGDEQSKECDQLLNKKEDTGDEIDKESEISPDEDDKQKDEQNNDETPISHEKTFQEETIEEGQDKPVSEIMNLEDEQNNEYEALNLQEDIGQELQDTIKKNSHDEENHEIDSCLEEDESKTQNIYKEEELDKDPDILNDEDKNRSESNPELFDTYGYKRKKHE